MALEQHTGNPFDCDDRTHFPPFDETFCSAEHFQELINSKEADLMFHNEPVVGENMYHQRFENDSGMPSSIGKTYCNSVISHHMSSELVKKTTGGAKHGTRKGSERVASSRLRIPTDEHTVCDISGRMRNASCASKVAAVGVLSAVNLVSYGNAYTSGRSKTRDVMCQELINQVPPLSSKETLRNVSNNLFKSNKDAIYRHPFDEARFSDESPHATAGNIRRSGHDVESNRYNMSNIETQIAVNKATKYAHTGNLQYGNNLHCDEYSPQNELSLKVDFEAAFAEAASRNGFVMSSTPNSSPVKQKMTSVQASQSQTQAVPLLCKNRKTKKQHAYLKVYAHVNQGTPQKAYKYHTRDARTNSVIPSMYVQEQSWGCTGVLPRSRVGPAQRSPHLQHAKPPNNAHVREKWTPDQTQGQACQQGPLHQQHQMKPQILLNQSYSDQTNKLTMNGLSSMHDDRCKGMRRGDTVQLHPSPPPPPPLYSAQDRERSNPNNILATSNTDPSDSLDAWLVQVKEWQTGVLSRLLGRQQDLP
eukprot:CFRG3565T1